ncbi:hypothetical protein HCA55_03495 [Listeria booriae]|uniref:Yip1 domain-containing protein n=1 Tax=Listeria booriae TaxID=1552123 RepID=A0A7X0XYN6_9LIST|nr:hypothetical protein [Listeria booriae]MBC1794178.1 hypothetical protein [Listeria booriae]MBC1795772.1 hypothetical protein [Listeria booriae]MBC1800087.1 hypothetical protein [Listeria booriae]MBC1804497.1 hypothetical protein [Listeria booriae]MBC1813591.1 hypothetical protein [Listeria booriae]
MIKNYFTFIGTTITRPVRASLHAEHGAGKFGLFNMILFVLCLTLQYSWNVRNAILESLQNYPVIQKVITTIFVSSGQVFAYIVVMMLLNITVIWLCTRYIMGIKEATFFKCAAGLGGLITVPFLIIIISILATWFMSAFLSLLLCMVALMFLPFATMYFIIGHFEKSRVDVYWISILVFILVAIITMAGMILLVQVFTSNVQEFIQQVHQIINERTQDLKGLLK